MIDAGDGETTKDKWASWIQGRRFGGDPRTAQHDRGFLHPIRDKVLDAAEVGPETRLLDVGCGDGLIAFGALERGAARVTFSDVSQDLLDRCRDLAGELGVTDRCRFVRAGAEDLRGVADGSVDVVTTRSVLIYVADKASAFSEFHRVLAPGGRISLFEPINRYFLDAGNQLRPTYDRGPVADLAERVTAAMGRNTPMDGPMMNFDERDLVELGERVGFMPLNLRLELEVRPPPPRDWEFYVRSSPNPLAPTLEEAMREAALTPSEIERYESHFRPLVESGTGTNRWALAYLSAVKPAS